MVTPFAIESNVSVGGSMTLVTHDPGVQLNGACCTTTIRYRTTGAIIMHTPSTAVHETSDRCCTCMMGNTVTATTPFAIATHMPPPTTCTRAVAAVYCTATRAPPRKVYWTHRTAVAPLDPKAAKPRSLYRRGIGVTPSACAWRVRCCTRSEINIPEYMAPTAARDINKTPTTQPIVAKANDKPSTPNPRMMAICIVQTSNTDKPPLAPWPLP